ncbi:MAG TPA: condensation domain-containing protein [Pirellulales bacterium]|jgi:thioesterase domain-containing protein/non-ribosomal peptide synthetase component F/acyl carrier protein
MKNVEDIFPLAPLQQLMLAHELAQPGSGLLIEQFYSTLVGPLDADVFIRAWQAVVERHALLRTSFAWEGLKKPVQVVRRQVTIPCEPHDWRELDEDEQQLRRQALLVEEAAHTFDLTKAPLIRLRLARLAEDQWFFLWTCHHLVLDGWCLGIVLRDVFESYETLRLGGSPALDPPGAFRDYLAWLASRDAAETDAYWAAQLADCPPPLRLPIERPRAALPPAESSHGEVELRLPASFSARLSQQALAQRTSQSTLLQAAWAILLARYAEQEDILIGVAVAGRPPQVARIESIVGPLVNNVPLRLRVGLDDSLVELCERLGHQQADAQPFEYSPLDQILRAANLPSTRRLFDTLVIYENYPLHGAIERKVGSLTLRDMDGSATSSYPLTLVGLPGDGLTLRLLYDRRRYETEVAARLLEQLATLLERMVDQPTARMRDLSLANETDARLSVSSEVASGAKSTDSELELRVVDCAGQPAPVGLPGALWVAEYDATGKPNGRFRETGYRAARLASGEIEYLGPRRATLRIGRQSVDPREIEAIFALHPLVERAVVHGCADRHDETQLAVTIVPATGALVAIDSGRHGLLLGQLRKFADERLPASLVPTVWRTLDALPLDAAGAVDLSALADPVRPRGELPEPFVAPRDELESRLAEIWSEVLGVEPVGVTDSFLDLGGYSSLAVTLLARLEEEFGRGLPLAAMFDKPTVAHLAGLLNKAPVAPEEISLVPIQRHGSQAPLFCVHPAGGTVFCYLGLARHLRGDAPLYGLQAQGIDGALAPHTTIEAMAAHYVRAMKTVQAAGPYRVCGWSTGGIIAFEIARQLRDAGEEVGFVGLFDAGIPRAGQNFGEADIAPMLGMMFPGEDPEQLRALQSLPVAEQLEYFRGRAELAQLLVAGAGAAQAQRIFEVFQANMQAAVQYQPAPIDVKLTLFRAAEDATPMHADPLLGWGDWAEVEVIPTIGSHLTMFQSPAVEELARLLDARLEQGRLENAELAASS